MLRPAHRRRAAIATIAMTLVLAAATITAEANLFRVLGKVVRTAIMLGVGGTKIQVAFSVFKTARSRRNVYRQTDRMVREAGQLRTSIIELADNDYYSGKISLRQRNAEHVRANRVEKTVRDMAQTIRRIKGQRTTQAFLKMGGAVLLDKISHSTKFERTTNGALRTLGDARDKIQELAATVEGARALTTGRIDKLVGAATKASGKIGEILETMDAIPIQADWYNKIYSDLQGLKDRIDTETGRISSFQGRIDGGVFDRIQSEIGTFAAVTAELDDNLRAEIERSKNMDPRQYEELSTEFGNNPEVQKIQERLAEIAARPSELDVQSAAVDAKVDYIDSQLAAAGIDENDPRYVPIATSLIKDLSKLQRLQDRHGIGIRDLIDLYSDALEQAGVVDTASGTLLPGAENDGESESAEEEEPPETEEADAAETPDGEEIEEEQAPQKEGVEPEPIPEKQDIEAEPIPPKHSS